MDDEPAEAGIAGLPVDKQARDLEFALFYTEQMPRLVAFLIVHGARSALAADVAQDAMIEAYRKWEHIERPSAWIRTVAARTWWRRIRQEQGECSSEELDEHMLVTSAADPDEFENQHVFLGILSSLPLGQRQVMAWTYDGYQPTEIAALLGIPAATVRSRLRDARAVLKKKYGSDEGKS